jgi:type IV fimbrial biogenesis protein FimT
VLALMRRIRRPSRFPHARAGTPGLTLIELLVVLALMSILLVLATPSFTAFLRNSELASAAHSFVASLNAARSEAMKRNLPALVMPLDPGRHDWTRGFVAFVDTDRDGRYTEGVDLTVLKQPLDAPYLSITGTGSFKSTPAYVRYDGSGFAKKADDSFNNLSISISRNDVSGTDAFTQSRRIFIARTGRLRICTPASASDRRCEPLAADS